MLIQHPLSDTEFEEKVNTILIAIEETLDHCGVDLDYEVSGGILTIQFTDQSKIIINRQAPLHQLWVAAEAGGFHLDYDEVTNTWKTDLTQGKANQGEELFTLLSRLCTDQAKETVFLKNEL